VTRPAAGGLVMICDVDLGVPDATRTHTVEVAANFAREGLAVDLIARGPDPRLEGVSYHRARGSEARRARRIADLSGRAVAVLGARRRGARRCYVRHSWSNVPILAAARVLGYRVVTQVDDVQYGRGYERHIPVVSDYVKRLAAMAMGRLAHGIVAVTPQIGELLTDQFHVPARRIAVLPNGVDVDAFRPQAREQALASAGLDPGCRYAVFCGRFESWVDFELLLAAFALVAREDPAARLLLVGDGPERAHVERLVDELELARAVTLTGFVADRSRVADLIGAATVALASHRVDYIGRIGVSPTKLAEYMAAGRAVVARDVPGLREVLRESGAGVVVPGEPRAMAAAIAQLLDPARADALGARGRAAAEQRYTWRSIVRRTLPLFE
jgi:glycosyltransferase involved in cell wall biosynthesis